MMDYTCSPTNQDIIVDNTVKTDGIYNNNNNDIYLKLCSENGTLCDQGRSCFTAHDRCDGLPHCQDKAGEHNCGNLGTPGFHTVEDRKPTLEVWETSAIVISSIIGVVLLFLLIRYCRKRWLQSNENQASKERYIYRYDPQTGRGSVEVVNETPAGTPPEKRQDDATLDPSHGINGDVKANGVERHSSFISIVRSAFDKDKISPSLNNLSSQIHNRSDLLEGTRPRSSSDSATRFVYRYNPATGKGSVDEVPIQRARSKSNCNCSPTSSYGSEGTVTPPTPQTKAVSGFTLAKHPKTPKTNHLLFQTNNKRGHKYTPTKGRGSVELVQSSDSESSPRISLSQCDLYSLHKQDAKVYKKSSPVKPKYVYKYNPSTGRGSVEMIPAGSSDLLPATSRSHGALHTVLEASKVKDSPCRRPARMGAKYVYKYNPNSGRGSVEIIPKSGEAFGGRRRNHHFNYQSSPLAIPQGQRPNYSQHLQNKGQQSPGTPKKGTRPESFQMDKIPREDKSKGISLSISNLLDELENSPPEIVLSSALRPRVNTIGSCQASMRRGTIQTTADIHQPSIDFPCLGDSGLFHMKPPEERRHTCSSYDRLSGSDIDSLGKQIPDVITKTEQSVRPTQCSLTLS